VIRSPIPSFFSRKFAANYPLLAAELNINRPTPYEPMEKLGIEEKKTTWGKWQGAE
jgi:hypothetical protein